MGDVKDIDFRRAHLLGEPCKILAAWPSALIQCPCNQAEPQILLIAGLGVVQCPQCKKNYAITKTYSNLEEQKSDCEVGLIVKRTESDLVM